MRLTIYDELDPALKSGFIQPTRFVAVNTRNQRVWARQTPAHMLAETLWLSISMSRTPEQASRHGQLEVARDRLSVIPTLM